MMRLVEQHILDLHQPCAAAAVVFLELHGDVLDSLLITGNHDVLQGIDPAARLFNFRRHQLAALFVLRKLDQVGEELVKAHDSVVKLK